MKKNVLNKLQQQAYLVFLSMPLYTMSAKIFGVKSANTHIKIWVKR